MKNHRMKDLLENIARDAVPDSVNLLPRISAQIERRNWMTRLRARPIFLTLIILFVLTLLAGAVYAIGRMTGYMPGVGFVETSALRVLAQPVSVTRDGITVSVEQVIVDSERTVIVYKTEGLTVEAANSKGEGGGPFSSEHLLRLPDGTILKEKINAGYDGGAPEPLIHQTQTEGGWPNYVWRLVYPPAPLDANELTLEIPILQNMPAGAAPENWEIPFRIKPAPPEMTFAPVTVLPTTDVSAAAEAEDSALSNATTLDGFTFQLDNVVELEDGFLFTGNLSWDSSVFPTGQGMLLTETIVPILTDGNNQQIPIERVQLDAPYEEYKMAWSYRTNRKAFEGPLTFTISSIQTTYSTPPTDFSLNLGQNPQIGQTLELNRDFQIEGHTLHLASVTLENMPPDSDGGGGGGLEWNCARLTVQLKFAFTTQKSGLEIFIDDAAPEPMPTEGCISGGGGGESESIVDPTQFTTDVGYLNIPNGQHQFSMTASIPKTFDGVWKASWNPPLSLEPMPTPQPGACLTLEKWTQLTSQNAALSVDLGGKIITTLNEGNLLPTIYVSRPDGSNSQKIAIGAWPSPSNDGAKLAYSAQDGLRVIDLASGQTSAFGVDGYRIVWSPDDSRVMFTDTFHIYTVNADGSDLQAATADSGQVLAPVGWIDNQTIVYSVLSGDGFKLKTYNLQNGGTEDLFAIHNKAGYAALSPDKQWLVFADREFGETNWGIFISRLDGSERRLAAEPEVPTAFASIWSPDGQWLVVNTHKADDENPLAYENVAVLVNPFTCEAFALNQIDGAAEGWSR
ncbi:MAG: hypothetical protein LC099_07965 [Anaerolineales bacterium]|nr:hypothetical protein [Anaerolineales bacterium]